MSTRHNLIDSGSPARVKISGTDEPEGEVADCARLFSVIFME